MKNWFSTNGYFTATCATSSSLHSDSNKTCNSSCPYKKPKTMTFKSRGKAVVEEGRVVPFIFLHLSGYFGVRQWRQWRGDAAGHWGRSKCQHWLVKLVRNTFGLDVHTKVRHPSFLGALIHTSVIVIPYPVICKGTKIAKCSSRNTRRRAETTTCFCVLPYEASATCDT